MHDHQSGLRRQMLLSGRLRRPIFDEPSSKTVHKTRQLRRCDGDLMSCLSNAFDQIALERAMSGNGDEMRLRWSSASFRDLAISESECELDDVLIAQMTVTELQKYLSVRGVKVSVEKSRKYYNHHLDVASAVYRLKSGVDTWSYLCSSVSCPRAWDVLIDIADVVPFTCGESSSFTLGFIAALGRYCDRECVRVFRDSFISCIKSNKSMIRSVLKNMTYEDFIDISRIIEPLDYCSTLHEDAALQIAVHAMRSGSRAVHKLECLQSELLVDSRHVEELTVDMIDILITHGQTTLFSIDATLEIFATMGHLCSESFMRRLLYKTQSWGHNDAFKILEHALRLQMPTIAEDMTQSALHATDLICQGSITTAVYLLDHGLRPSLLSLMRVSTVEDFVLLSQRAPLSLMAHQHLLKHVSAEDFTAIIHSCHHFLTLTDLLTIDVDDDKFSILMTVDVYRDIISSMTVDHLVHLPNQCRHLINLGKIVALTPSQMWDEAVHVLSSRPGKRQLLKCLLKIHSLSKLG